MRDELYSDIQRYLAMTDLLHYSDEDDPGREERDRAVYGKEYGLLSYPDGKEYFSPARLVRFLVEICGHSYTEALEAAIEDDLSQPRGARLPDLDAERDATSIRSRTDNVIEALFNLKFTRLTSSDQEELDFAWAVTRSLMAKAGPRRLPAPAKE